MSEQDGLGIGGYHNDKCSPSDSDEYDQDYLSLKQSLSRAVNTSRPEQFNHGDDDRHTQPAGQMYIDMPELPMSTDIVLAAMQYLPTPVIVLSSAKTVLVANEAMGRLLGLWNPADGMDTAEKSTTSILKGKSLSQIGVDMVSDGVPVWVSWEKFLDNIAAGTSTRTSSTKRTPSGTAMSTSGETTPTLRQEPLNYSNRPQGDESGNTNDKTVVHDTVVDVVVSSLHGTDIQAENHTKHILRSAESPGHHTAARLIISVWGLQGQRFFTLTFTASSGPKTYAHSHMVPRATSATLIRSTTSTHSHSLTPTSSSSRSSSTASSEVTSPSEVSLAKSSFPPNAAPSKCLAPSTFTDFHKLTRMKDAMLSAMDVPVIAMWKDESVVLPNKAMRQLLSVTADPLSEDNYDFMSRFTPYTADFTRQLDEEENPIITLCRTQQGFSRWQIGIIKDERRLNYDVSGHPIFDEKSGEFFAGLVAFKDVTEYREKIAEQTIENENQFSLICDTMPQMLWTTRPDGYHDYFSQRWYDYTGLTPRNSLGLGWKLPFHEDDMVESVKRWKHSLATGDEYRTEYRCLSKEGEWRWMLGRALPLRESKSGAIVKWFGTCTDIQDIVDARHASRRAQQQLQSVLRHAEMTMWTINRDMVITYFEGDLPDTPNYDKGQMVGKTVSETFDHFSNGKFMADFKTCVDKIYAGSKIEITENKIEHSGRWFRSRLVPQMAYREDSPEGAPDERVIDGIVGISMEVTNLKQKEQENIQLLANETAAKESSKMKSSFLANMSHEIRTPIAGVLGMSELLMDTKLDPEQSEFAQNIQRSANSLLTVINDILDFSKIESGRLDIEEVQFSLGIVLSDVAKMLSFAAQRKGLDFISDIDLGIFQGEQHLPSLETSPQNDLILLGDPGRVRQILTNLLTNSIKFTSDGYVKMSVKVVAETNSTTTVQFCVEDTGIGIEEEVKKRLFRPFSQADSSTARRFGGTGLGLTISKNLVDLMKGQISLDSKLDNGTTAIFSIPFKRPEFAAGTSPRLIMGTGTLPDRIHSEMSLSGETSSAGGGSRQHGLSPIGKQVKPQASLSFPVSPSTAPVAEVASATNFNPSPLIQRKQFHVLVVEDNLVNSKFALKTLQTLGFTANAVWNGKEALDYLLLATTDADAKPGHPTRYPMPSLVLMDCQMPVLDGYRATHTLRRHQPYRSLERIQNIPIIAMTASAIQGDREKCMRAGMDDYLAKPVQRATLEKMIVAWLSGEKKLRPIAPVWSMSESNSEQGRPAMSRHGTDQSSNCPGLDRDLYGSPPEPVDSEKAPISSSIPTNMGEAIYRTARRRSLTKTLLASQITGAEPESMRVMRRAEAEEKASILRDAKLMSVAEGVDVHDHLGSSFTRSPLPSGHGSSFRSVAEPGSRKDEVYQRGVLDVNRSPGTGPHALTKENMEKLDADHGAEKHGHDSPGDDGSLGVIVPETPYLPEVLLERELVSTSPDIPVCDGGWEVPANNSRKAESKNARGGRLGAMGRQISDWSTSTATMKAPTGGQDAAANRRGSQD